jgi:hypothetical protein
LNKRQPIHRSNQRRNEIQALKLSNDFIYQEAGKNLYDNYTLTKIDHYISFFMPFRG